MGMLGFIGFSFLSPYFELKKIFVLRDNPHVDAERVERVLKPFYGKNMLLLSHKNIKRELFRLFPEFQKIKITEHWPEEIKLKIETSSPLFNFLNQETADFSVISKNGTILDIPTQKHLPTIKGFGYIKPIAPHQKLTDEETLKSILLSKSILEQEMLLPLKTLHYFPAAHELHLISKGDMAIWIDLKLPIDEQFAKLENSANRIGLYTDPIEHVDLRIPSQIFWKPRGQ